MDRKTMVFEYCMMYLDVFGTLPDPDKVEKLEDSELKKLHLGISCLFNRMNQE